MKKTNSKYIISLSIFVQTLAISQQILAGAQCSSIFADPFDRSVYIEQTSQQSKLKVIAQTVFSGATALQLGTPTMLRGIKIKDFFWVRDGHILTGMKRAYGTGISPWGPTEIFTQSGIANTLSIKIQPAPSFMHLSEEKIQILRNLYSNLKVLTGENSIMSSKSGPVPNDITLILERSDGNSDSVSFESESRSLVDTILNDSQGLLGVNPKLVTTKFEIPKKMKQFSIVNENLEFFGNFGKWEKAYGNTWTAYKTRVGSAAHNTSLSLNGRLNTMSFWLENSSFVNEASANVRRIAWSLIKVNYSKNFDAMPRAKIDGINGVSVVNLKIDASSIALFKLLDSTQNDPHFNVPLTGLDQQEKKLLNDWFLRNFDQQDFSRGTIIRFEDIVNTAY